MAKSKSNTPGAVLANRCMDAIRSLKSAPRPGSRDLPKVRGISPTCISVGSFENVLTEITEILVATKKVFRYGDDIVVEDGEGRHGRLRLLSTGGRMEPGAPALVANFFLCGAQTGDDKPATEFPPPSRLVETLLQRAPTVEALPRITTYATRPVYDSDFILRGPGWHPEAGILVHSFDIDPVVSPKPNPALPVRDRLPPHLQRLLVDCCFKSDADLVNAVAVMLTGLLVPHFVDLGKPIVLVDGNQRGVGKTYLSRVTGILLDGEDPRLITFGPDEEELSKRICALLRDRRQSVLIFDNAKTRTAAVVSSPVIESNSMARDLSLRILGQSANFTRPNDLLWFLTMNATRVSPDLVSRGIPVRFHYDGIPEGRTFSGPDPLIFAAEHRRELLGELAGMVQRWTQEGRPDGSRYHRCAHWARIIGGIMTANGFSEFLTNLSTAAAEFDTELDELAALAEEVVSFDNRHDFWKDLGLSSVSHGKLHRAVPVAQWAQYFVKADIGKDKLDTAKSDKSKTTYLGNWLSSHLDREVEIEVGGQSGRATLRVKSGRARQKSYFFEVTLDVETGTDRDAGDPVITGSPEQAPATVPKPVTSTNSNQLQAGRKASRGG